MGSFDTSYPLTPGTMTQKNARPRAGTGIVMNAGTGRHHSPVTASFLAWVASLMPSVEMVAR